MHILAAPGSRDPEFGVLDDLAAHESQYTSPHPPARRVNGGENKSPSGLAAAGSEEAIWADRISRGDLELADLVTLKYMCSLSAGPSKDLGEKFYDKALAAFKAKERERGQNVASEINIAVFGSAGCGVYVKPEKVLWYSIMERAIQFDWSAAHSVLGKVQILANRVRDLWPIDLASVQEEPSGWWAKRRQRKRVRRLKRALTERQPHIERTYELCTSVFSAVMMERLNRATQTGANPGQEPSPAFEKRVSIIWPGVKNAELEFDRAAQRYARGRYGVGMIFGVVAVSLLCIALAVVFYAQDLSAWYGVAIPAGGIGAVVSVLQRMASGKLRLDYDAGPGTLTALGAVRPLIGAVFGVVLFAAVEGGWLPALGIAADDKLGFYAVLGFLAGFNERFAQDMLVASATQLSIKASQPQTEEDKAPTPR